MQNTIGEYPLFQRLSDEECSLIESNGEWVRARNGQTIIAEERMNKALFIVVEGSVDVRLLDSTGTNIQLASDGPGMMIGEYSFIDGLPAAATAVATTDVGLFVISHVKFRHILETHDRIGRIVYRNLLEVLVKRLREANAELDLFSA